MPIHDDPEGIEVRTLLKHVDLRNKEVLEVGCGEGRLTFKYFEKAKRVVAIDPVPKNINAARRHNPKTANAPEFRVGRAERMTFPDGSFDVAFFTWSLCCIDIPAMGKSLEQAWRVLRPHGTLVNLQPSLYQPFGKGAVHFLVQGQFGTTVDDERYRQARLALKYSSLIEKKFKLVSEEEFTINTYYDTLSEAVDDFTMEYRDQYKALTRGEKARVKETLESMKTKKGIKARDNVILTVLSKTDPPK